METWRGQEHLSNKCALSILWESSRGVVTADKYIKAIWILLDHYISVNYPWSLCFQTVKAGAMLFKGCSKNAAADVGLVLCVRKLEFKRPFIAWIFFHYFSLLACGMYEEIKKKDFADEFWFLIRGHLASNKECWLALPFLCGFTVLKKISSCWFLPEIQTEAIKPGKGFVSTCAGMNSDVFLVRAALEQDSDSPSVLNLC